MSFTLMHIGEFLKIFLFNIRLIVAMCFLTPFVISAQNEPPNVIVIISDDMNDSVEGMGGHSQALTPNINRLMDMGVQFTNAHANAPICGPSRASLWTGLYPKTTGLYGHNQQQKSLA